MPRSRSVLVTALAALVPAAASAVPVVLFSEIASSPTSDVPGLPAGTRFDAFERPFASPDGQRWIISASSNLATTEDEVIIVGGGVTTAGAMTVAREGTPTPFDSAINYGLFGQEMGINNAGQFAFDGDTNAATTMDAVIVRWNGTSFDLVAREGSPTSIAGQNYGATQDSVRIISDGNVAFRSTLSPTTTKQILWRGTDVRGETDVTVPAGQMVMPDQSIDAFTIDRYNTDATGANVLYGGDLNGPTATDLIMVLNDRVLAQEGSPLSGSGFAAGVAGFSTSGSQHISADGAHFIFRGNNNDGTGAASTDWVFMDGAVIAATDRPIFTGATENFDDTVFTTTFFRNEINNAGDYVIGGTTNNPDVARDAVLVFNNSFVLLREGDAVDVNGNGLPDDNAFISVFNNDDAFLTDDLHYYFTADLIDGAGTSLGQAFMVIAIPEPSMLALFALAAPLALRRRRR